MKKRWVFSLVLGISMNLQGATESYFTPLRLPAEIEASCRVKAKEIAAETYRTCVADQKSAQIEQIKKDYAAKLQALKAQYETELKKLGGSKMKATTEDSDLLEKTDAEPPAKKRLEEKAITPKKTASSKPTSRKSAKKSAAVSTHEMTVQLKPAPPSVPMTDDSVMDLPEPIPVEELQSDSSF